MVPQNKRKFESGVESVVDIKGLLRPSLTKILFWILPLTHENQEK